MILSPDNTMDHTNRLQWIKKHRTSVLGIMLRTTDQLWIRETPHWPGREWKKHCTRGLSIKRQVNSETVDWYCSSSPTSTVVKLGSMYLNFSFMYTWLWMLAMMTDQQSAFSVYTKYKLPWILQYVCWISMKVVYAYWQLWRSLHNPAIRRKCQNSIYYTCTMLLSNFCWLQRCLCFFHLTLHSWAIPRFVRCTLYSVVEKMNFKKWAILVSSMIPFHTSV